MTRETTPRTAGMPCLQPLAWIGVLILVCGAVPGQAQVEGLPYTYSFDFEFQEGTLINVNLDPANQLQLIDIGEPFNFIWVAASGRGTIVKIDTVTGDILGEYWSSPSGMGRDPSRTTVDANGNVWSGNRAEAGGGLGSVVHIGLEENGQCVDRNGNGSIDTSTGLGDIRPWTNAGGADSNGGVSTAEDECVIHYVRTSGTNVRSVAVDASNNVWVGGYTNWVHELYDSSGVAVPGTLFNLGCGGYGALVDASGILWSANITTSSLLRYDPVGKTGTCIPIPQSYGLGIDSNGFVWNSRYSYNVVAKVSPAGVVVGTYGTLDAAGDRGVTVTPDDDVWVANSGGSTVSRLNNDGTFAALVTVGTTPTGLAVDAAGKVWVTNYSSHSVMRIDPATNAVDLTVSLGSGAYPYNYSDMTGSTLTAPPDVGTWTVVHDSLVPGQAWGRLGWTSDVFGDGALVVTAASSEDGATFGPFETVTPGVDLTVADGRYLKVSVQFTRSGEGDSPVLYDLTIEAENSPPVALCTDVYLEAEDGCQADGSIDDGSYDPDDNATSLTLEPPPPYALGDTEVTLTIVDDFGESDTCTATVHVFDSTAPEAFCNAPATIVPSDAPVAFTATADDFCAVSVEVVGYNCWAVNGAGRVISKLESCVVSFAGDTVTIDDSGGIGDHIEWFVVATDSSGNETELTCSLEVVQKG